MVEIEAEIIFYSQNIEEFIALKSKFQSAAPLSASWPGLKSIVSEYVLTFAPTAWSSHDAGDVKKYWFQFPLSIFSRVKNDIL